MDVAKTADILRVTGTFRSLSFANVKSSRLSLSILSTCESQVAVLPQSASSRRGEDIHVTETDGTGRISGFRKPLRRTSIMSHSETTISVPPQITLKEIETLPGLSPESRECIRRLHSYKLPQFDLSVSHEFPHIRRPCAARPFSSEKGRS